MTMTASEFAELLRVHDCVIVPVAIGGYLYAVKRGAEDTDIYRVSV